MKKFIVSVLLIAVITGSVFAQSLPGWASPQSTATMGRLRSSADDFIRPDAYTGVRFDNWFGMASFSNANRAILGYATKVGDTGEDGSPIYIGALYHGSLLLNSHATTYTEGRYTWLGEPKNGVTNYTSGTTWGAGNPYNQAAVLVGAGDMGFRLSFVSTMKSFSDSNFLAGGTPYKSIEMATGAVTPQLAWSMTKNLHEKGVRPWATLGLEFNRNYRKTQQYVLDGADWVAGDVSVGNSENTLRPEFNIGLGGFILANNNGWRTSADLEYRLRLTSWDNEYNYIDSDGKNRIKSYSGVYTGTPVFNERSQNDHRIRPSISTQWNGDKLRLRAKLDLNMLIDTNDTIPMYMKDDNTGALAAGTASPDTPVSSSSVTVFTLNPDLALAMQWQLASKVFLNAGAQVSTNTLVRTATSSESYMNENKVENSSYKTVAKTYGTAFTNQLFLGATLNAADNMFIEAVVGTNGQLSGNRFNTLGTTVGDPLNFGSIMVGLRF